MQMSIPGEPKDPLFPTADGTACSKRGVTKAYQHIAIRMGVDEALAKDITGHAGRVAGAMFLTRAGVSEPQLMAHARWGSDAIRRYARRAHEWGLEGISLHAATAGAAAMTSTAGSALTNWATGGPVGAGAEEPDSLQPHQQGAGQSITCAASPCTVTVGAQAGTNL